MTDKPNTKEILQDLLAMEDRKQRAISELLKERQQLQANTAARLKEIASELKQLGYKLPRNRKAKEAAK